MGKLERREAHWDAVTVRNLTDMVDSGRSLPAAVVGAACQCECVHGGCRNRCSKCYGLRTYRGAAAL